jgi:heat shock protein HslJ
MIRSLIVLSAALALSGCGPQGPGDNEPAAPAQQEAEPMNEPTTEPTSAASDPLTGTSWWVEDIAGGGVIDNSRTTVEFVEPGRVAGRGGCNRYMGGYERDGDALSFGPLAGTMMACPEALMNQEQRFYQAMEQVTAWHIDADTDLLHLLDEAGGTVVRASRLDDDAEPAG